MNIAELVPVLQVALSPVVLISGIGLLLLSMTNRLGRVVDRSRVLSLDSDSREEGDPKLISHRIQIDILFQRARLLTRGIVFAVLSILCAALLIMCLFLAPLLGQLAAYLAQGLLILSLLSLVVSQVFLLRDVSSTLRALHLEIHKHLKPSE